MSDLKPRARPQLVRQPYSDVFHLQTCRTTRRRFSPPWDWGNARTAGELALAAANGPVIPCKVCKPISTLTEWERFARLAAARGIA